MNVYHLLKPAIQETMRRSIKTVAESPGLTSIPSVYAYTTHPREPVVSDPDESIPVIDFSLLTSDDPNHRSKSIQDLATACRDWGFFMLVNHGIPESLMNDMVDVSKGFFSLTEEKKQEYEGKHVLDPIRCGTSFNAAVDEVLFWRDYFKIIVHPVYHSPSKPVGFSEIAFEYTKRFREVNLELLRGISESLGLKGNYISKALNIENGLQILTANLYPPCPQPELAMGLPPHTDHGLLTILFQHGAGGLQVKHKECWYDVEVIPNSFLVNIGDQVEMLSNGKYKSVLHRAIVNNKTTRLSVVVSHGPSQDTFVSPAPELLENESQHPGYIGMKYQDYLEFQQSNKLDGRSCLDRLRIQAD